MRFSFLLDAINMFLASFAVPRLNPSVHSAPVILPVKNEANGLVQFLAIWPDFFLTMVVARCITELKFD